MARMPGRVSPPQCPVCRAPAGPDCPTAGLTPRQVRRRLAGELRDEVKAALAGEQVR